MSLSLIQDGVSAIMIVAGLFFLLLGSVGIIRFPDCFSRLHPAGKADTLGASLLIIGLATHQGWSLLAFKLILVQVFIFLINPVAAHALGRAALRAGEKPWTNDPEPVAATETPSKEEAR